MRRDDNAAAHDVLQGLIDGDVEIDGLALQHHAGKAGGGNGRMRHQQADDRLARDVAHVFEAFAGNERNLP